MPAHLNPASAAPRRVLMVVANPSTSTTTGWPVGFWASEFVHPWHEFVEAGYEVAVASPDGGPVRLDPLSDPRDESGYSRDDILSLGFLSRPDLVSTFDDTLALADLDPDAYDAIVICGGQSPMFTFRENANLQKTIAAFFEAGKPTAALCHGTAALLEVRLSEGDYLVEGRTMTGFANSEEEAANAAAGTTVMPWQIEDAARERGANFVTAGTWRPFAIRDGRLITGQQQYSGRAVARLVIEALGA